MKTKKIFEAMTKGQVLGLMPEPPIWIITVQYPTDEGGSSVVLPSRTREGAWAKLADYCRSEWEHHHQEEAGEDDRLPVLPADNSAAIDAYFEYVTQENYTIREYNLED